MNPEIGDKLTNMMVLQKEAQRKHGYDFDTMTQEERSAYIKEYTQHLSVESGEMLKELPYFKPWKSYSEHANATQMSYSRAEFADMLHFFINVALGLGFTADELYREFLKKHKINYKRQNDTANYKPCTSEGSFNNADI